MFKICIICNKKLPLTSFYFRKDNNKFRDSCKSCFNEPKKLLYKKNKIKIINRQKLLHKIFPWKRTLTHIKQRCENINSPKYKTYGGRGIKCLITLEELKELWFRDKAHLLKKPSIDRIDNNGNYTFKNCRYVEFKFNTDRANELQKKNVLQYDLNGNFIKEWVGINNAASILKLHRPNITKCINGKRKSCGGFIWKTK